MTIETITRILYVWLSISAVLPFIIAYLLYKNRKIDRNLQKEIINARFYEETLFAAKDGYFSSTLYKKKEYQHCSRRLATLLNLKNGENSTYGEIFNIFLPDDKEKLTNYFNTLKKSGVAFETIAKTKTDKNFVITGQRISSADSEINADCLWFRDISKVTDFIDSVTEDADKCRAELKDFRILIDNIPCPISMRDENLNVKILNKHYLHLLGLKEFKELNKKNAVLHDLGNTSDLLELAKAARSSNTPQKKQINMLSNGDLKRYEITETPFYDPATKLTRIIGSLVDITEFDEAKRNYRFHLDSHLDILSALDTAFGIINANRNFTFVNAAFIKMWNLPANFFEKGPQYNAFLDKIREMGVLPEVPDFKAYKDDENKIFENLTEQHEDLLYIPDGRTFRRIIAPHPDGTLIAYEDITEHLATTRKLSDSTAILQGILGNITDSVALFSPTLKLTYYNAAFAKLWNLPETTEEQLSIRELLDMQEKNLPEMEDWQSFRDNMQKHITTCTPFTLKLKNNKKIKVTSATLADMSLMLSYHKE